MRGVRAARTILKGIRRLNTFLIVSVLWESVFRNDEFQLRYILIALHIQPWKIPAHRFL